MGLRYRKSPKTGTTQALIGGRWRNWAKYLKPVDAVQFSVYGVSSKDIKLGVTPLSVSDEFYVPKGTSPAAVYEYLNRQFGDEFYSQRGRQRRVVAGRAVKVRRGKIRNYREAIRRLKARVDRQRMARAWLTK